MLYPGLFDHEKVILLCRSFPAYYRKYSISDKTIFSWLCWVLFKIWPLNSLSIALSDSYVMVFSSLIIVRGRKSSCSGFTVLRQVSPIRKDSHNVSQLKRCFSFFGVWWDKIKYESFLRKWVSKNTVTRVLWCVTPCFLLCLMKSLDLNKMLVLEIIHLVRTIILRKTNISYPPIRRRSSAYQGVNISFSENFAYVLNEWSLGSWSSIYYVHKISRKTNNFYPLICTSTPAYQGLRNVIFTGTSEYEINGWTLKAKSGADHIFVSWSTFKKSIVDLKISELYSR